MKETEFKTLMHCGMYVDVNLLGKGIYTTDKPYLYNKYKTVESLIQDAEKIQEMMGSWHISEKYFESLKQCELITVNITIPEKGSEVGN